MAPSCASSVPPLIGDYPRCRAAAWQAAPTLPLSLSVAAASLGTEASLPVDMPGGREGLEGDTDAQGSARRRSGLAHTSTRRVATPRFPASKSGLGRRLILLDIKFPPTHSPGWGNIKIPKGAVRV